MVTVEVSVRDAGALALLRNGERKARYAIVNALNSTIKQVQGDERGRAQRAFTLRKPEFVLRQVAVITRGPGLGSGFASVKRDRYEAVVRVGQKSRLLLSDYEEGGPRMPFKGRRVAVPITGSVARPTLQSTVPDPYTFRGLNFVRAVTAPGPGGRTRSLRARGDVTFTAKQTARGGVRWQGEHGTFILDSTKKNPEGGVYQRIGPGRDDVRLIYSFKTNVRITPRLKFLPTAKATAEREFPLALRAEVDKAFMRAAGIRF